MEDQVPEPRPTGQPEEKAIAKGTPVGKRAVRGNYVNPVYGFSLLIPKGFAGTGGVAGGHGISITLSEQPKAHIWASAYFIGDPDSSVDKKVTSFIEYARKYDAAWIEVLGRETARLHNLPAVRATVRYQDRQSGRVMVYDFMTAFRTGDDTGVPDGIEYVVGLLTPEERYSQDKVIYDEVVKSWRTRRVTD